MADATYDAIVIGGGANGLLSALYLQDAGFKTAIFERNMEIGGGLCGDEVPLPGFLMNTCATNVRFYSTPCYEDFKLGEYGLSQVFPKAGQGMIFDDETCLVTYPVYEVVDLKTGRAEKSQENVEKTLREISRFSERDAEAAMDLIERVERKWRKAYRDYMFNPPTPWGTPDALELLLDDRKYGIDPQWPVMTAAEFIYDLFESPEMQCYMLRAWQTSTGNWPDDAMGLFNLVHTVIVALNVTPPAAVRGGSHAVAHAMQRAFSQRGGKFYVLSEVDKILVENGKAKGVRLVDGTEIGATKCVVSDVDCNQTFLRFIGEQEFDRKFVRKVQNIRYDRMSAAFWGMLALHELPRYKAEAFNPDCAEMPRTLIGPKDPFYLAEVQKLDAFTMGVPRKLCWWAGPESIWDRSRAPEGKHFVEIEQYTGNRRFFTDEQWLEMKKHTFPKELIRQYQIYAPNITEDNIIAHYFDTPPDIVRRNLNFVDGCVSVGSMMPSQMGRFRPFPEISNYKTPIEGLYLCGATTHVGGGIRGSCGYNCYKVIANDFGLKKHWEEAGRTY
jgi:phytoene dehydrogenase-like protein